MAMRLMPRRFGGQGNHAAQVEQVSHSRWETPSSGAAVGGEFISDIDIEEAFDATSFDRAVRAVSEEPTSWSDENAIKAATKRFLNSSAEKS